MIDDLIDSDVKKIVNLIYSIIEVIIDNEVAARLSDMIEALMMTVRS